MLVGRWDSSGSIITIQMLQQSIVGKYLALPKTTHFDNSTNRAMRYSWGLSPLMRLQFEQSS